MLGTNRLVCSGCAVQCTFLVFVVFLGINEGKYDGQEEWVVARNLPEYKESFKKLSGGSSKISGAKARVELVSITLHLCTIFII